LTLGNGLSESAAQRAGAKNLKAIRQRASAHRFSGRFLQAAALLATSMGAAGQGLFAGDGAAPPSAEQLERGRAAYTRVCMSCHGASLEGTQFATTLKGPQFEARWRGRTRAEFSAQLRNTMPPRGIGALGGQAYADVEAYILDAGAKAQPTGAAPAPAMEEALPANAPPEIREFLRGVKDDPLAIAAKQARADKLARLTPVTDAMLRNPPPGDWLIWRRGYEGQGYSPLQAIDRANVARLRGAWSWSLPESGNEITPLVHDGVMFIYSGPVVQALDATNGDLLWQYLRILPDHAMNGREARAKTLALYGDLLYAAMVDGHVVALDARSGKVAWDQEIIPDI
jgi:alcohol dehydrogenase (cytochrome c)